MADLYLLRKICWCVQTVLCSGMAWRTVFIKYEELLISTLKAMDPLIQDRLRAVGSDFRKKKYRQEINRISSSLSRSVFTMSSPAGNQPKSLYHLP